MGCYEHVCTYWGRTVTTTEEAAFLDDAYVPGGQKDGAKPSVRGCCGSMHMAHRAPRHRPSQQRTRQDGQKCPEAP